MSSARLVAAAVLLMLASACREWPDPEITGVVPPEMTASTTTNVTVQVKATLASTIDYANGEADIDNGAILRIGDRQLGAPTYPASGAFEFTVPTVFQPGTYDVTVTLEDGRVATRSGGFTVLAGTFPSGYTIDPIGPQQRLVPFDVVVRANGDPTFAGNVRFEVPTGASVGPTISDTFVNGVLTQRLVVDSPRSSEILIVTDIAGNRATSNTFDVQ
jgi:hypothetical protein